MATSIGSLIRKATKKPEEKFNILSYVTHERYGQNLGGCYANFYLLQNGVPEGQQEFVKGDWKEEYAKIPSNTVILPKFQQSPIDVIPSWINFDGILAQHKFGQLQHALQLGNFLNCPTIMIEHTMPTNKSLKDAVPELKKVKANINLFISETSRNQWGFDESEAGVIEHGIDSDFWKPTNGQRLAQVLTVGNDMIGRSEILGFDIFQRVTNGLPIKIVGDTRGLSVPAKNEHELKHFYNQSMIYFNPSRYSPIPMSLLEAAACGCAIVTTDNNLISNIFTHKLDSIKSNDENELRSNIQYLLSHPDECQKLGTQARETVKKRFNLDKFVNNWNKVFDQLRK